MNLSKRNNLNKKIIHTILIIGSIFMTIPFIWMLLTSFKTLMESMQVPPTILPKDFISLNYKNAVSLLPFFKFYLNTLMVIIIRVLISTLFAAMAGMPLQK